MKHTAGPWEIEHDSSDTTAWQWYVVGPARVGYGYGNEAFSETALANARLISSAPDLLRALEKIQTMLDNQPQDRERENHTRRYIEAAISKATGGE